jgi:hypothetical protein
MCGNFFVITDDNYYHQQSSLVRFLILCFFFLLPVFSFQSVVQYIFIPRTKEPHIRDPRQMCGKVYVFICTYEYFRFYDFGKILDFA